MSFTAKIQADIDNFQSNLDRAQARMDRFSKDIGEKVAKLGSTFQAIGGAISIGITAPVIAAGTAAYNMAADFEDALGATDQIFKSSADEVKKWAGNLETYFGISKKEALEYSNLMGSMLINIGNLTEEQASKQGAKLIELAGDLTAMYGGRTQDAVRALTGALKGNNTMLDNYGMAVNDALVKTRALEMGLIKQGQEMSLSAKQAATLSLIYEQTAAAQGQAAREADGASGAMRAFRTEITNLTTEMGAALLPIITPLINRLKDMVAGFREMSPEMQQTIVKVAAVAAALGPLMVALGSILKLAPLVGTAFAAMTGPIGIAIAAVAGAAALIIKNWDSIKAYFTTGAGGKLWASISDAANQLWQRLSTIFGAIRDFVIGVWDKIGKNVIGQLDGSFKIILSIVDGAIRHITEVLNFFIAAVKGDFKGMFDATKTIFENGWNTLVNISKGALSNIQENFSILSRLAGADDLADSLERSASGLRTYAQEAQKALDVDLPRHLKMTKEELEAFNKSNASYAALADKKINATKEIVATLNEAKTSTKDYRAEMVSLFASWGLYTYQVENLSNQFKAIRDNARAAGASIEEMATIAARELGEKLALALGQSTVQGKNPTLTFDLAVNVPSELPGLEEAEERINGSMSQVKANFETLTLDLSQVIGQSISDLASSIGEALATGGNVFDAIGNSIIKSVGAFAKTIGEQMIAIGVAGIALKNLMKNPFLLVAAGAALVALGSAASASIGKQASSIGTGGYQSSSLSSNSGYNGELWRGALYNNDKQVVELKLHNTELRGALNLENNRNKRLG